VPLPFFLARRHALDSRKAVPQGMPMQDLAILAFVTKLAEAATRLRAGEQYGAGALLQLCQQAMQAGRAAAAIPVLQELRAWLPQDASLARLLGFALRQEQRLDEADLVFSAAAAQAPGDAALSFGLAQTRFERGLPAAALFAKVQALAPADLEITRNRALAMAGEGDREGAKGLLRAALKTQPGWLDGHKVLASLRWTGGDAERFAASYSEACKAQPGNAALWIAWFGALAQTRDWAGSAAVLDQAERHVGATPAILSARLFVAVESGEGDADGLLEATAHITGDTIALCRIRHALRRQRLDHAQTLIAPLLAAPSAPLFWPYQSLIWRLAGDDRHHWLDRPDDLIQSTAAGLSFAELTELAEVLRGLHTMERPYAEQTVRGGTQTDRSVLLRHEPILQRAREAWMETIRGLIAQLPPQEERHPFLSSPRGHLLLGGSWSVRLAGQGHNVPHTHPMGWLSSSLYVAIPDAAQRGPAPAGHITFGTPPPELGLDLPAYRTIAPEPGMIVTFPSSSWHAVAPFSVGERLMIALDIRPPTH
jgi:tetratricopeptide (TPR) repeat protein